LPCGPTEKRDIARSCSGTASRDLGCSTKRKDGRRDMRDKEKPKQPAAEQTDHERRSLVPEPAPLEGNDEFARRVGDIIARAAVSVRGAVRRRRRPKR
jgi:hypothetical protein